MPGKRYGILIANQDYPAESGFISLSCPLRDANALHDVLADPEFGEFAEVRILPNKTRAEVLLNVEELMQKAERDDLVLIYFSGHGKTDRRGNLYLAASDTKADRLLATGIDARAINEMIRDFNVSKKALVLDCCYAGAFPVGKGGDDLVQDRANEYASGSGTYVLMATGALSLAEEDPMEGLSVLTRYMVEGLRGKADANRDGVITVSELSRYVNKQVTDYHNQKPSEAGLDIQGEIAIGKSGIKPDTERRAAIRKRLLAWAQDNDITNDVLTAALTCLEKSQGAADTRDRKLRGVLDRIVTDDISHAQFLSDWIRLWLQPMDPPPPPQHPDTPWGERPNQPSHGAGPLKHTLLQHEPQTPNRPPGTKTPEAPHKPSPEDGVLLSIVGLALGAVWTAALAVIFDEAGLSFLWHYDPYSGYYADSSASSGVVVGAALAAGFGLRRLWRKRAKLGWIAKVICVIGSLVFAVAAIAASSLRVLI